MVCLAEGGEIYGGSRRSAEPANTTNIEQAIHIQCSSISMYGQSTLAPPGAHQSVQRIFYRYTNGHLNITKYVVDKLTCSEEGCIYLDLNMVNGKFLLSSYLQDSR